MDVIQRFTAIINFLKENRYVSSDKEFGEKIGENANGVSDLKAERKKITIDHLLSVKNNFPNVNINWLLSGEGELQEDYKELYYKEKEQKEELQKKYEEEKRNLSVAHKYIFNLENDVAGLQSKVKKG